MTDSVPREMTPDDQAFWDAAFCAALTGMCAKHGDVQNDELAMSICRNFADASLATRKQRRGE